MIYFDGFIKNWKQYRVVIFMGNHYWLSLMSEKEKKLQKSIKINPIPPKKIYDPEEHAYVDDIKVDDYNIIDIVCSKVYWSPILKYNEY